MTHIHHALGSVQWGDVATWVGGVAAVLAVAVPLVAAYRSRRGRARKRTERQRAQSGQVLGWSDGIRQLSDSGAHAITVSVQNSSSEPVYGLRAAVGDAWYGDRIGYIELDQIPAVMPPKSRHQQTVRLTLRRTADGRYDASPPVELIFRDASGRYWHRRRDGSLTEITKDLPPSGRTHFFADT